MKTIIDFANKVKSLVDGRISNIANVEQSPSTHAYTVGKQLIFNGLLCKATSAIAVGDTLAVGTNLALSDNVVEQIYSLNQGLTNSLNEIADMNNVLGAKNLLPNNAESLTYGGITFTVNSDGSVTANGTATELVLLFYVQKFKPNNGNYILSGGIRNGAFVFVNENNGTTFVRNIVSIGNDTQFTLNYSDYDNLDCGVGIESGVTVNNETFYPMLRPASIQDDTYVPYSMTNREMTPYVQAISNPNLLDNPWFTVNQRGQSSYTNAEAYTVDRWKLRRTAAACILSVTDDGVIISASDATNKTVFIAQYFEEDFIKILNGKTITASVLKPDGTILKGTIASFNYQTSKQFFNIDNFVLSYEAYNNKYNVRIMNWSQSDITIRAVKLEVGSVSTLAMDTAPNYQQELAKCQRYFQRISIGTGQGFGYGVATSTTTARIVIPLSVPLRDAPTISISNADQILINGSSHTISKMEFHAYRVRNNFITVTVTTTGLTNEQVCVLRAGNTVETLEISADIL